MIQLDVVGVRLTGSDDAPVLVLQEQDGSRLLPVWVSAIDAAAIAQALEGKAAPRPMTHELLATVVGELGPGRGECSVTIDRLEAEVFHAALAVGEHSFDCRPSDAVTVAVLLGAPVFAADDLMDQVAVEVDEKPADEVERFKEFLEGVTAQDFSEEKP